MGKEVRLGGKDMSFKESEKMVIPMKRHLKRKMLISMETYFKKK